MTDNSTVRRCDIVDREQHIADQKSLGAMEYALQGVANGQLKREEMIKLANRTLDLVQRFCMEAKEKNDAK